MPESILKIDPPDLGNIDTFTGLPPNSELTESEYSDIAVYDFDWRERQLPGVSFDAAVFKNFTLCKTKWRDVSFRDVLVTSCDLAGADWAGSHFSRAEISSSRLTGFVGAEGRFENVVFRACKCDYANFQMAKLNRCRFEQCDLSHATFENGTVSRVTFVNCNLTNARFVRSELSEIDLRGSRIDGIELDLSGFKALHIDMLQAPVIAALTGVRIDGL